MICKVCGTENDNGLKFCTNCGTALENVYVQQQPDLNSQPNYNNQPGYVQQPTYTQQPIYNQQQQFYPQRQQQGYQQQPYYTQQPYVQPTYVQPQTPAVPKPPAPPIALKGLAIPGMIFGIMSLIFTSFFLYAVSVPLAVLAFIFGIISSRVAINKYGKSNGVANCGFVCAIITFGIILTTVILALVFSEVLGANFLYEILEGIY